MKILEIRFKNINSLKGEHHINFEAEPLQSNSLFAITGPTGSGKSTLLDVICLALFNQIPRMNKVSKSELAKTKAVITRHQKEAFAEVIYESAAGKFLSHWDIQYNRNDNLNDYEMRIKDLHSNEEFDLKKSEVPAQNEALIGLSYKQFIKSILLAQGEFAKFLQAKDSERKKILEQITGTEIYRKLGMLAFEKAKHIQDAIKENKRRIADTQEELLGNNEIDEKKVAHQKLEAEKEKRSKEKEVLLQQQNLLNEKNRLAKDLVSTKEESFKFENELKVFLNVNEVKIQKHSKTQAFAEELQQWKNKKTELERLYIETEQIQKNILQLKNEEDSLIKAIQNILPHQIDLKQVTAHLEAFRIEVNRLTHQLNDVRKEYKLHWNSLKNELRKVDIEFKNQSLEEIEIELDENLTRWKKEENKLQLQIKQFEANYEKIASSEIADLLEKAIEAKQLEPAIFKLKAQTEEYELQIKKCNQELKDLPNRLESKINLIEKEQLKLDVIQEKKQHQLTIANLDKLRSYLQNGEACPLCGSEMHPYAKHLPKIEDDLDLKIKEQKHKIQQFEKERNTLNEELISLQNKLKTNRQQFRKTSEDLATEQQKWETHYADLSKQKGKLNWEDYAQQLKKYQSNLEQIKKNKEKIELSRNVAEKLSELQELTKQGTVAKNKLNSVYEGSDIDHEVGKLKSNWDKLSEKIEGKKETKLRLKNKHKELANEFDVFSKQLEKKVIRKGFKSIDASLAARLSEQEFQNLQHQQQKLAQQVSDAKAKIQHIEKELTTISQKIKATSMDELQGDITRITEEIQEIEESSKRLFSELERQKEKLERISALQKAIKKTQKGNEYWLLMAELIGDAEGKKFNDFAQDLSLEHLLSMANVQLKELNDRYQLDRPSPDEGSDLVVIDFHMGSERRSVRTLSGGETFVVSLALALALSDLASKNVQIDSLFIDEGFGTLDPETLDQTLDTLERLQAESNKTIGIISHVEALKERIQTQIKLSKNGQGYSSLEVI
ncbi:AAA family ATPase [Psychroflexus salis]|uniref:Nuclease SbcCD subunit C n=1 Tax=Psychroflexus salis TaxID=1526574 RepID=A0A917E7F0_9FLAO|nr:AAA family ATPase [Psychroflexus salis]GGE12240.1 nuclease SbcCD subunit C [Psychroflexus salis]